MTATITQYTPNARRVSTVADALRKGLSLAATIRAQIEREIADNKRTDVDTLKGKFNKAVRVKMRIKDTEDPRYFSIANTLKDAWNTVTGKDEDMADVRGVSDWMRAAKSLANLSPKAYAKALAKAAELRAE